jgi:ABC-2 type transport system ATP-binding protein
MGRKEVLTLMERLREKSTVVYSTHILDDVQHVSDTVAILKKGLLLAQAPISEHLRGSGGIVYDISLKGEYRSAYERITNLPWVTGVRVVPVDSRTMLEVNVTDESKAEEELPKLVFHNGDSVVTAFGKKRFELEDVFMEIVEGAKVAT